MAEVHRFGMQGMLVSFLHCPDIICGEAEEAACHFRKDLCLYSYATLIEPMSLLRRDLIISHPLSLLGYACSELAV